MRIPPTVPPAPRADATAGSPRRPEAPFTAHDMLGGAAVVAALLAEATMGTRSGGGVHVGQAWARTGVLGIEVAFVLWSYHLTRWALATRTQAGRARALWRMGAAWILPGYVAVLLYWHWAIPRTFGPATAIGSFFQATEPWYWGFATNWLLVVQGIGAARLTAAVWPVAMGVQAALIWTWFVWRMPRRDLDYVITAGLVLPPVLRLVAWYVAVPAVWRADLFPPVLAYTLFLRWDLIAWGAAVAWWAAPPAEAVDDRDPSRPVAQAVFRHAGLLAGLGTIALVATGAQRHGWSWNDPWIVTWGFSVSAATAAALVAWLRGRRAPRIGWGLAAVGRVAIPAYLGGVGLLSATRLAPWHENLAQLTQGSVGGMQAVLWGLVGGGPVVGAVAWAAWRRRSLRRDGVPRG